METSYPSLSERAQSIFIDLVFIIILMFGVAALLDKIQDPPDWIRIALFFGIWAVYEPLCISLGCTLGQYLTGLRVRSVTDTNRHINILMAFIRYLVKTVLGWLAFITISGNEKRRAVHDFAAGSVMIRKEK